jgi:beta-mannanase
MRIITSAFMALLLSLCSISNSYGQTQKYASNITATSARMNWSYDLTPKQDIYYGAYASDFSAFLSHAGKPVSIHHKFMAWGSSWNAFPVSTMNNIRSSGAIPLLTWEPWAYNITDPNYRLSNIINGNFDAYITAWATAAKNWGHPFFLRFAHEMNGKTWYPWQEGLNGNTTGQYVLAWKHVVNIFRSVGANNVNWVWCPNVSFTGSTPMQGLYPGDDYVDWVALDGYNRATSTSNWKTFQVVYTASFAELAVVAPAKNIMIAEIGSSETGGNKAAWITDAIGAQVPANPKVKALVWFNHIDVHDFRIQSSAASASAFSSAIASPYYLSNQFGTIGSNVHYMLRYRAVGDTGWTSITTSDYFYDAASLLPQTQYEFKVHVITGDKQAEYTSSAFFTTGSQLASGNGNKTIHFSSYPNPFHGQLMLKANAPGQQAVEIRIYDVHGTLVYKSSGEHTTNEDIVIGNQFANGLYFVHMKAGSESGIFKMVKAD